MIQFQFGHRIIVTVQIQICHKETLQITFTLYAISNGRDLGISLCHKLQRRFPLTIKSHIGKQRLKTHFVYRTDFVILLQQIGIVLLANIIIWNAKHQLVSACSLYC